MLRDFRALSKNRRGNLMRSEREVEGMLDKAAKRSHGRSKFPGMSYEEGARAALEWVVDEAESDPLED